MGVTIDLVKKYENIVKVANNSNKATSELNKLTSSNNKTSKTEKKDNFKEVLDTKSKDDKNNMIIDDKKNTESSTKVEDIEKQIEELEENIDELPEEKVIELLNNILNLLNELKNSDNTLELQGTINNDILNSIIEKINSQKETEAVNLNDLMSKLSELLETDVSKEALDSNSLKLIEKLLTKLNSTLDENINSNKDVKNIVNNLLSDISEKVDNSESNKVLTLEEMLNKNNSNGTKEDLSKNESNLKENVSTSKEDKFLNKLLNKDDSLDKFNLFSIRSQLQGQSVNNVQATDNTTINTISFTNDLIQDVKLMVSNALKELTVKINPGNLGQMTISLIEENGVMKANLKATSKETVELLAQNLGDIKKQLDDQNLKIADVNIELYQDDTTFFKQKDFEGEMQGRQNGQTNVSESNRVDSITEELVEEEMAIEDSNINFLA